MTHLRRAIVLRAWACVVATALATACTGPGLVGTNGDAAVAPDVSTCAADAGPLTGGGAVTSIEVQAAVPAAQINAGLGFNIHTDATAPPDGGTAWPSDWSYAYAQAAGATEVRVGFAWGSVEPMDGPLASTPAMEHLFAQCAAHGLQPLILASYGPAHATLPGPFTVRAFDPANPRTLYVNQSLVAIAATMATQGQVFHVRAHDASQITVRASYDGALIDAVDAATNRITFASVVNVPLAVGAALDIIQLRYPSVATDRVTDPSVVAWTRFVRFLAAQIAAHGLTGRVELWNEPPWTHDPWDCRANFYDPGLAPAALTCTSPNYGFATALAATPAPTDVRYNWGGTHKSGLNTLLGPRAAANGFPAPTRALLDAIGSESFHPYGDEPEAFAYDPACVAATDPTQLAPTGTDLRACLLPGTLATSTMYPAMVLADRYATMNGWTLEHNVTETGLFTTITHADAAARFNVRQFLWLHSVGVRRVTFFALSNTPDASGNTAQFVDDTTTPPTPRPDYVAIAGLMHDVATIAAAPAAFTARDLPSVAAYRGTWPLMVVPVVGRAAATDAHNTVLLALWQRTHIAYAPGQTAVDWIATPAPPPGLAALQLPAGYVVTSARDLITGACVATGTDGAGHTTVTIGQDPVFVRVEPLR